MNKELKLILDFENECKNLAQPIIDKLCRRAMRSMNKKTAEYFGCEDYPSTFSFIDILSIKIQDYSLDEINPHLEKYIDSTLDLEYKKLSKLEKLVISYSDCSLSMQTNYYGCHDNIYITFCKLLDEHYSLKKIQNFIDRMH